MSSPSNSPVYCGDYCCDNELMCCTLGRCRPSAGACRAKPLPYALTIIGACGAVVLCVLFVCIAVATRRRAMKLKYKRETTVERDTNSTPAVGTVPLMNTGEEVEEEEGGQ
ncbi:hypothetical protein LSM04_005799 [Trypanosoma melophagium]|uniref:uncharacterized protein n=1 Tax=Trypanosoma melophagium TaxID=715481 RepID=UPI00351A6410|nr:hypothetical protein LSM04_005799 [Trypanosoma melophagium]